VETATVGAAMEAEMAVVVKAEAREVVGSRVAAGPQGDSQVATRAESVAVTPEGSSHRNRNPICL